MELGYLDCCNTDHQKRVITLHLEGKKLKEISEIVGSDESNVRAIIRKVKYRFERATGVKQHPVESDLPNVLLIDIETSPLLSYIWKVWNENAGQNQIVEHSHIMCFAAKWLGEEEIIYQETRTDDDSAITKTMIALLDKADFVVAHNADRFDIPRIKTAAITNGFNPPSPFKVIDTLKIARKHFKFERNTLEHIADILGCTPKKKHAKFAGFELWRECLAGNDEAWQEMMEYNIQDVHTLEEVYLRLRPYHSEHPNVGAKVEHEHPVCSKCGSVNLFQKGYTHTDVSKFPLFQCKDCGGYSRGRANEYPKQIRANLVTTVRG